MNTIVNQFIKPYKTRVKTDNIVAKNLKKKGFNNEEINDYLQVINEECDD